MGKKNLFLNIVELKERFKCHFSKNVLVYFQNRFSVIFRQLSIFSIFEHMLDCRRNCDSLIGCQICSFVKFTKTDNHRLFEDIIVDERDLSKKFLEVFKGKCLFSLSLTKFYGNWIDTNAHKIHSCFYFVNFWKPRQIFIYFLSILIRIYVNIFFLKDEKLNKLIPEKFKIHRKIVFSAAVDLIWKFCLNVKFNSFFEICDFFSPIVDYNCCCFKIVNKHYLKFVERRENYVLKHYKDKNYSIKNFYKIWRLNSQKLNDYLEVIVLD